MLLITKFYLMMFAGFVGLLIGSFINSISFFQWILLVGGGYFLGAGLMGYLVLNYLKE